MQETKTKPDLVAQFKAARRASTPLMAIATPDPAATQSRLVAASASETPLLSWNCVSGASGLNEAGRACEATLKGNDPFGGADLLSLLKNAARLPRRSVLIVHNAHRFLSAPPIVQAIWNLRDAFKSDYRALVMLGPSFSLPAELRHDVLTLDEPLPDESELRAIIETAYQSAELGAPDEEIFTRALDATCGLAAFPAEQVVAMSVTRDGLDVDALWERKNALIDATPGLRVYRGREKFADLGGIENAKNFLRRVLSGKNAPRAIVWMDEIEKQFAGLGGQNTSGDSSGTTQDQLNCLLQEMQNKGYRGFLFVGPPGAAKSALAKAAGNEAAIPTIGFDLGAAKGSLVGESEAKMREALKVVETVSQGAALFIATCNSITQLPPELRRRFKRGTFFFDLPTREERATIWALHCDRHGLTAWNNSIGFNDEGWTGAEIETCCELADELGLSLDEAARYVVPVSVSAGEQIESLRQSASGKYLSASHGGVYRFTRHDDIARRAVALEGVEL